MNELVTIQMTNYCIRIPCHYILFTYVPMQHRLTLANVVGVVWTTYLTHKADISKEGVQTVDVLAGEGVLEDIIDENSLSDSEQICR